MSASATQQRDLGPDLKPLGQLQCQRLILAHAWRRQRIQIIIMVLALLALVIGVLVSNELCLPIYARNESAVPPVSATNWADWLIRVQAFLGIGTLLVALFVWYAGMREDWEDSLPKRMSVFFFHASKPIIVCRYIWLEARMICVPGDSR